MNYDEIAERMLVPPGTSVKLKDFDPDWLLTREMESLGKERAREQAEALLEQSCQELVEAQELLYATGSHAVLIELQGRDAAGKDGTVKHAMSGVNPQGCEVHSFTRVADSVLEPGVVVGPHCDVDGAAIGARSRVGPFARLRPGTVLAVGHDFRNTADCAGHHRRATGHGLDHAHRNSLVP